MAKQITNIRLNSIVLIASGGIMLLFFLFGIYVQKGINKQAKNNNRNASLANSANINFTANTFLQRYWNKLDIIDIYAKNTSSIHQIDNLLKLYQTSDSTIADVWVTPLTIEKSPLLSKHKNGSVFVETSSKAGVVPLLSIKANSKLQNGAPIEVGIKVNLKKLHSQISATRQAGEGYFTLTDEHRVFIYNPDDKLVGKPENEINDSIKFQKAINGLAKADTAKSSHLEMYVQRNFYPMQIKNGKILVTVYLLQLDFGEFVYKTTKNIWLLVALPCLLLIIIVTVSMYIWRKTFIKSEKSEKELLKLSLINEKQAKEMANARLENLKGGVNPHFLFNSLGNLVALIKRAPSEAVSFTHSLSKLYRYLLDTENTDCVPVVQEIAFALEYFKVQKIRFGDQFTLDVTDFSGVKGKVPPLSVQILVENCIKHNSGTKENPIHISISSNGSYIIVANNINTRDTAKESSGKGQVNLTSRYTYLTTKACNFYISDGCYIAEIPIIE